MSGIVQGTDTTEVVNAVNTVNVINDVNAVNTVNVTNGVNDVSSPNVQLKKQHLENLETTIDVPELVSLLQCIGFSLQNFEKNFDKDNQSLTDIPEEQLQVNIICMKSHMKATLLKEKTGCKCPSKEDTCNAQFWNISACSPSLPGNVTVSKSSLIPTVPADKSKLVNTLLLKAIDIINSNDTAKVSNENFIDLIKSTSLGRHRSSENLKTESTNVTTWKNTGKPQNWDGRASSPKGTSSPIPELSSSLSKHTSLDSDKVSTLVETLKNAQKLLSNAIELAGNQNSTFIKRARRISDIKISPLATDNEKSSTNASLNSSKTSSNSRTTPKKSIASRIGLSTGEKKRFLIPPSKLGLLRIRKSEAGTASTTKVPLNKKETPKTISKDKTIKIPKLNLSAKTAMKTDASLTKLRTPSKISTISNTKKK